VAHLPEIDSMILTDILLGIVTIEDPHHLEVPEDHHHQDMMMIMAEEEVDTVVVVLMTVMIEVMAVVVAVDLMTVMTEAFEVEEVVEVAVTDLVVVVVEDVEVMVVVAEVVDLMIGMVIDMAAEAVVCPLDLHLPDFNSDAAPLPCADLHHVEPVHQDGFVVIHLHSDKFSAKSSQKLSVSPYGLNHPCKVRSTNTEKTGWLT